MLASVCIVNTRATDPRTNECCTDVPYIANWIYEHPGLDLKLQGIWIADPSLTYGVVQQDIPSLRFIQVHIALGR